MDFCKTVRVLLKKHIFLTHIEHLPPQVVLSNHCNLLNVAPNTNTTFIFDITNKSSNGKRTQVRKIIVIGRSFITVLLVDWTK